MKRKMYVRVAKTTDKTTRGVYRRKENKVNCLHLFTAIFTYSVIKTSLNGLSVDFTLTLNNGLILKKAKSVNMTEQIGGREQESPYSCDHCSLTGG